MWQGDGEDVAGRWRGCGCEMARMWLADGEDVAGRWRGCGREMAKMWLRDVKAVLLITGSLTTAPAVL